MESSWWWLLLGGGQFQGMPIMSLDGVAILAWKKEQRLPTSSEQGYNPYK